MRLLELSQIKLLQQKHPPIIAYTISSLSKIAIVAKTAPKDKDPTSPINTSAGYELYQRKPSPAPTIVLENIATSDTPG